jgi:hypothetical protein
MNNYFVFDVKIPKQYVLNANDKHGNFFDKTSIKNYIRQYTHAYIKKRKNTDKQLNKATCTVYVSNTRSSNKFDPPNTYPTVKVIIDEIVKLGYIKDDSHQYIKKFTFLYGGQCKDKKGHYRFDILLKEVI